MLESTFSMQFSELMDRLRQRFSRCDLLRQAECYLRGLLSQVERKNSWQLAEAITASTANVGTRHREQDVGSCLTKR